MKYSPEIIGEIVRRSSGMFSASEVRVVLELLESTDEQKALRADAERLDKLQEIFIKGEEFHIVMCEGKNEDEQCEHHTHPHFEAFDWSWRGEPVRASTLRGVIDAAIDEARHG